MSHQSFTTLSEDPSSDHSLSAFLGSNAQQQSRPAQAIPHSPSQLYRQRQVQHQPQNSRDQAQFNLDQPFTPKSMDSRGLPDCSPSELSSGNHQPQPQPYYHHQPDVKYGVRSPNNRHSAIPPTPTSPQNNDAAARTPSFEYAQRQQHRPYEQPQRYHQQPPTPSDLASPGAQHLPRGAMAQAGGPIATSPGYASHPQYSAYQPHSGHEMYQHGGQVQYQQREAWTNQYGQQMYSQMPVSAQGGAPGMVGPDGMPHNSINTVYSFVPIPGAAQHKRPRRRFEEIERMYKCGWQGCEKAYGTLNHLNAHVTMQSHGSKRTPEEFKEIRKEWKAKKKEEENQRKAEDDRARQDGGRNDSAQSQQPQGQQQAPSGAQYSTSGPHSLLPPNGNNQLPPIGYGQHSAPTSATSSQPYSAATDGSDQRQYAAPGPPGQMYQPGYPYTHYPPQNGPSENPMYGPP